MRLKTGVANPDIFARVAQSLERLGKKCVLKLMPDKVQFIIVSGSLAAGMQVFSDIDVDWVFEEYRIESAHNNEIYLEVMIDDIVRAFKSACSAADVVMKLTKKNNVPLLTLTIHSQTKDGKMMNLFQEIPVGVLTAAQVEDLREPAVPDPQVHIIMPPLVHIRNVVDRMKSISNHLLVSANMNGELRLSIQTDAIEMTTYFKGLINPELDPEVVDAKRFPSAKRDVNAFAEARVDIKDFAKFLHCYHANPVNVVCCIIENFALVLYAIVGPGSHQGKRQKQRGGLTFYIPIKLY